MNWLLKHSLAGEIASIMAETLLFGIFLLGFLHAYDQEWSVEFVQLQLALAAMVLGIRFIGTLTLTKMEGLTTN